MKERYFRSQKVPGKPNKGSESIMGEIRVFTLPLDLPGGNCLRQCSSEDGCQVVCLWLDTRGWEAEGNEGQKTLLEVEKELIGPFCSNCPRGPDCGCIHCDLEPVCGRSRTWPFLCGKENVTLSAVRLNSVGSCFLCPWMNILVDHVAFMLILRKYCPSGSISYTTQFRDSNI